MIDTQLSELMAGLMDTSERWLRANALAGYLGGEHLIVLIPDPELGMHLPAPGFPQTLPRGRLWRDFLHACLRNGTCNGTLCYPDADRWVPAFGFTERNRGVAVLLGGTPDRARVEEAQRLLPLTAAAFRQEARARISEGHANMARESAREARALATSLEQIRRELQQAVTDRDLALGAAQMGTWRWDAAQGRSMWSELQEQLFGLAPGSYDGTQAMFLSAIHPDDQPKVTQAIDEELRNRSGYRMTYRVVWPGGQIRWLSAHGHVLTSHDGSVTGFAGVTLDVTEQKHAEDALVQQAQELARSNADLQQFAWVTSHDLQEPIRTIVSYAQLLSRRYSGRLDEDADTFLSYIVESGRRLGNLVHDLLSYSRVTNAADVPRTSVPLEDALSWALQNLQHAVFSSGARITHDPLPVVTGNAVELVQLFQNLVSNAIKYRSTRPLTIHIGAELQDGCWQVSVRDNGIGIEPQYRERIFGLFKRLHGSHIAGTGIGLAICRKIVEKHGGSIRVEPAEGGGSTFIFTIRQSLLLAADPSQAA